MDWNRNGFNDVYTVRRSSEKLSARSFVLWVAHEGFSEMKVFVFIVLTRLYIDLLVKSDIETS